MKTTLGAGLSELRGKIGNLAGQNRRSGAALVQKSSPYSKSRKARSAAQAAQNARYAKCLATWQNATAAEKAAWDACGEPLRMSGFNYLLYIVLPAMEDSLVGYWPFSEREGLTAKDFSGTGNTGYLQPLGDPPGWFDWEYGSSLYFTYANRRVGVPDNSTLEFTDTQACSFAFWANRSAGGVAMWLLHKLLSGSGYLLQWRTTEKMRFALQANLTGYYAESNANIAPYYEWAHIGLTYDHTTAKFFRNGVPWGSGALSRDFVGNNLNFGIGGMASGGSQWYGFMARVMAWNRALSDSEMLAVYQTTKPL